MKVQKLGEKRKKGEIRRDKVIIIRGQPDLKNGHIRFKHHERQEKQDGAFGQSLAEKMYNKRFCQNL